MTEARTKKKLRRGAGRRKGVGDKPWRSMMGEALGLQRKKCWFSEI